MAQRLDALVQDLRYAWRSIGRAPAFSALAVATFAVGIGVNTAVFTVVNAIALKPLPVRDGANVYRVQRWFASGARGDIQYAFSEPEYIHFRNGSRTVTDLVAAAWPARVATKDGAAVGQLVSDNFFTGLGAPIAAGRALLPGEGSTAARPTVVLSHGFWERRFNADPSVVGTTLTLNGVPCTIAGVTSADFIGTANPPQVPDFWAPLGMQAALLGGAAGADGPMLQIVGRVREDAARAPAELTVLANQLQQTMPPANGDRTIAITVERAKFFGGTEDPRFRASVAILMMCVGMLLVVACANVANMALARASSRQREMGIRIALGAGRGRIVRQLVTESIVLAALGGAAGLLASAWFGRWLGTAVTEAVQQFFGGGVRFVLRAEPDWRVFGYALAASITAGVLAGVIPAARASTPDLVAAVNGDEGTPFGGRISRSRARAWLIGAQVAASVALLTTAAFLTRGLIRARVTDPGMDTRHAFIVLYRASADRAAASNLLRRVVDGLRQAPGIDSVALLSQIPFTGTWTPPIVVARPPAASVPEARTLANYVSPTYFEALGVPIVRGRTFSGAEAAAGARLAVVSESTARAFWPGADPVGRHFQLDMNFRGLMADFEVVGAAKDVRTANISRVDPSYVYLLSDPSRAAVPAAAENWRFTASTVVVRANGDAKAAVEAVRATIARIDPALLPELDVINVESTLLRTQRLMSGALSLCALVLASLSLTLAAVGIYGTLSYLVSQRVREIGIRVALGARRADVLRLLLGQGFMPLAAGACVGLGAALAVGVMLRRTQAFPGTPDFLFGVGVFDPLTFIVLFAILTTVACAATWMPARRATRVEPMIALRVE